MQDSISCVLLHTYFVYSTHCVLDVVFIVTADIGSSALRSVELR